MAKFYKIPMRTSFASTKNKKLIDILKEKYPNLYEMEEAFANIHALEKLPEEVIARHQHDISEMYKIEGAPEFIIAEERCNEMYEYWTLTPLKISSCILRKREISEEEAYFYILDHQEYQKASSYLFPKKKEKSYIKRPLEVIKKIIPCNKDN